MSRQPELERILQAWWEYEGCHASEKDAHRQTFNQLLDETRALRTSRGKTSLKLCAIVTASFAR